jgi:hypothetical protein
MAKGKEVGIDEDIGSYSYPLIESATGDMEDYRKQLKAKVPVLIEQFKKANFRAVEYKVHSEFDNMFQYVVVRIKPVQLSDTLTGKTGFYTKARMTLSRTRLYVPWEWAIIEFLP